MRLLMCVCLFVCRHVYIFIYEMVSDSGIMIGLHTDLTYRQTSNISGNFVVNTIFDHSDVLVAPPVGATLTTSSFST